MIRIEGFPVPPSDNDIKKPVRRFAKGGARKILTFADSDKYLHFKSEANLWYARRQHLYKEQFEIIRQWVDQGEVLELICDLRLHRSRIWTQAKHPQRYDAPNRLKALMDTLSKFIGIDDKVFFKTTIEKVEIPDVLTECFNLTILQVKPRREHL